MMRTHHDRRPRNILNPNPTLAEKMQPWTARLRATIASRLWRKLISSESSGLIVVGKSFNLLSPHFRYRRIPLLRCEEPWGGKPLVSSMMGRALPCLRLWSTQWQHFWQPVRLLSMVAQPSLIQPLRSRSGWHWDKSHGLDRWYWWWLGQFCLSYARPRSPVFLRCATTPRPGELPELGGQFMEPS